MTEIDYRKMSMIRPGQTRLEVAELLGKPAHGRALGGPGIGLLFGASPEWNPDGKDHQDTLEEVTFYPEFHPEIDFYGLRPGMTLEEAGAAFGTLHLTPSQKLPDTTFEGWTPDNYRIAIWFMRDGGAPVDDVRRLRTIRLSYPHSDEYIERKSALHRKIIDEKEQKYRRANAWKDITDDDDAMLMDWAAHCKPWNDYSESQFIAYAKWLKQASPDERHMAACRWNWDYGLAPLIWIIRQPDCDIATALTIYFACNPAYHLEFCGDRDKVVSVNLDGFDFLMELKNRVETNFYKHSDIAFDSRKELESILRSNPTRLQIEATIPSNIKEYYDGRVLNERNSYGGLQMPDFRID